jgi:hypothetical protein
MGRENLERFVSSIVQAAQGASREPPVGAG